MKKTLFLITALLICTSSASFAATKRVRVMDFSFSPATISAAVGDVIIWKWVNGMHTTTSTSVPAGARTWNKPIDSTHTQFRYVLRVAGTYNYQCNFHFAQGMVGTITVTAAPHKGESPTSR